MTDKEFSKKLNEAAGIPRTREDILLEKQNESAWDKEMNRAMGGPGTLLGMGGIKI